MPIPLAAIAAPIAGLLGSGLNALSQSRTNKRQEQFSLDMYNRQRADALADYNMQNQYNSPAATMQRFKDANLSPHLIYGQTNNAAPIRSTDAKQVNYVAPTVNPENLNVLGQYYELRSQEQQLKNMAAQGKLIEAQTVKTKSETDWRNLQKEFFVETMPYRSEGLIQSYLLKSSQQRLTEENITKTQQQVKMIRPQINKIIADTNLAVDRRAQLAQLIENAKVTYQLLGEKVKTEQYENEVQQKIKSFGVAGSTVTQLLRFIFGK